MKYYVWLYTIKQNFIKVLEKFTVFFLSYISDKHMGAYKMLSLLFKYIKAYAKVLNIQKLLF